MNSSVKEEKRIVWENNEKREEGNVVPFPSKENAEQEEAFRTHIEITSPGIKPAEIIYITSGFGNITATNMQCKAA